MAPRESSTLAKIILKELEQDESNDGQKKRRHGAAIEPAEFVNQQKECAYCHEINNCKFKYMNNGSRDQPRYKCLNCKNVFTHGFHGRVKGRKYKKRYEEPKDLRRFTKTCQNPRCGAQNHARFLYYNNKKISQPRYVCNSCNSEFQLFPVKKRRKLTTSNNITTSTSTSSTDQYAASVVDGDPNDPAALGNYDALANNMNDECYESFVADVMSSPELEQQVCAEAAFVNYAAVVEEDSAFKDLQALQGIDNVIAGQSSWDLDAGLFQDAAGLQVVDDCWNELASALFARSEAFS